MESCQTGGSMTPTSMMINDLVNFLKIGLSSKFGLFIFSIVITIYFFSLWSVNGVGKWGMYMWVVGLAASVALAYYTWYLPAQTNGTIISSPVKAN